MLDLHVLAGEPDATVETETVDLMGGNNIIIFYYYF